MTTRGGHPPPTKRKVLILTFGGARRKRGDDYDNKSGGTEKWSGYSYAAMTELAQHGWSPLIIAMECTGMSHGAIFVIRRPLRFSRTVRPNLVSGRHALMGALFRSLSSTVAMTNGDYQDVILGVLRP